MRRLTLVPDGWPCAIEECPPGPFIFLGVFLGFKSEYKSDGKVQAFNSSGEFYCRPDRVGDLVQPVVVKWEEFEDVG